jgi:hypothetical protein
MTCYITNQYDHPINVWHDGSGPHIQISKQCCETYNSLDEAQERLDYLRERTGRRLANLKVSTFAKF